METQELETTGMKRTNTEAQYKYRRTRNGTINETH